VTCLVDAVHKGAKGSLIVESMMNIGPRA